MRILNIFCFFVFFISQAQIKNGEIEYGLGISAFDGLEKTTRLKDSYGKAMESAKYLKFSLLFDKELSFFKLNESMGLDDNGYFYAKLFSGFKGEVYQNKSGSLSVVGGSFGTFIVQKEANQWVLSNETKEIEGFLCYKATSENVVKNSEGVFRYPVIAWYCPKIPLSYGPNGYGGLPGLILELQVRNILYGVEKINLNLTPPKTIPKMKKHKIITEKELNDLVVKEKNNFKTPQKAF